MTVQPSPSVRRLPRFVGLVAGGLIAFLIGGPLGFLVFLCIALLAAAFAGQR